ncbi:MAG: pseudouridine synthase [Lachnospiraceae bacterium]|nr:pseudouridine synthase [Lachnospiraceae bacterium]
MRLNKYMAECGMCSRREADRLIEEGRVFVNGMAATLGTQVTETDSVTVNGKELGSKNEKKVYIYYKPVGVTCTEKDKHAKVTVTDSVKLPVRVTYAGRLDKDSEGLLLLTNDGELIDKLMRGANRHEKEYVVKVQKEITEEFIKKMGQGVYLKELDTTTRPCEIHQTGKYTFQIILTQGLNRQIRRMCQTFGYEVKQLKRIRINDLTIGTLKPGQYRELSGEEQKALYSGVGL